MNLYVFSKTVYKNRLENMNQTYFYLPIQPDLRVFESMDNSGDLGGEFRTGKGSIDLVNRPRSVHIFRPLPAVMVGVGVADDGEDGAGNARCLEEVVSAPPDCVQCVLQV